MGFKIDGKPPDDSNATCLDETEDVGDISAALGVATVLQKWCPDALSAFLDDVWFSFTWNWTTQVGEPDESKFEIGRIKDVVTMGILDNEGCWKLMVSYNISFSDAPWTPNTDESMLGEQDVKDPLEVDKLGRSFVKDLVTKQAWLTGRKMRHDFFIEYAPLDAFEDGIAMNPHWLYRPIDLAKCTTCGTAGEALNVALSRCSKCGTAAYCSSKCQSEDWPVHKAVCNMSMEDRGKALHLTQDGGLIRWCQPRTENVGDD